MWIFQAITTRLDRQVDLLRKLLEGQRRIEAMLRRLVVPRPGPITFSLVREEEMGQLVYVANLPALPDPVGDIAKQRLAVIVNDVTLIDVELGLDVTVSPEFRVDEGANVRLSLTYLDDANPPNASEPATQEFVGHDTIAPDAPGVFGEVTLLREEN